MENEPKRFLTARQAADELGVSVLTIQRMCRDGRLPARKMGPTWLIDADDLPEPYIPDSVRFRDWD